MMKRMQVNGKLKKMTERKHKISIGTLGSAPCQISLNKILIELEKPRITRIITCRYHGLREGLIKLESIKPVGFCISIMTLYYHQHVENFEQQRDKMTKDTYTHARCCYKMLLKKAIKRVKNAKK